jgi:hypothetical protein
LEYKTRANFQYEFVEENGQITALKQIDPSGEYISKRAAISRLLGPERGQARLPNLELIRVEVVIAAGKPSP